jgi:hypothetical protein
MSELHLWLLAIRINWKQNNSVVGNMTLMPVVSILLTVRDRRKSQETENIIIYMYGMKQ